MMTFLKSCFKVLKQIGGTLFRLLGPAPGWLGLKRWILQIVTIVALASVSGFLLATLGLLPIKASSGHWPITAWILKYGMTRSVSTQSMLIEVPALDDPGLVLKGATHFENGCAPCHGNPTIRNPRIALQMTPNPPYLPPSIDKWRPRELFYIIKHGVKFTGMPAWPSQERDDEVWAVVAFLMKFPELKEHEYWLMVRGEGSLQSEDAIDTESVPLQGLSGRKGLAQSTINGCQRCHGANGIGRHANLAPRLAGQRPDYFERALIAFKQGERHSGIMEPIAAALSDAEIHEIALYYRRQLAHGEIPVDPESKVAISRGEAIAQAGVPNAQIPICSECHGPSSGTRNPSYPNLAGQYADYLVLQLELMANRQRGGSKFESIMHPIAEQLTVEQRRDVAVYYQSLAAPRESSEHSN